MPLDFNECELMEEGNTYEPTHYDWMSFIFLVLELLDISQILDSWDNCKRRIGNFIKDECLLNVIKVFGDEAFSTDASKTFPNYDRLEKYINEQITKEHGRHPRTPLMFSWLSR